MFDGADWTTIFVALISASAASIVPVWLYRSGIKRERDSVAGAVIAEVSSLIQIAYARGYLSGLKKEYQNLELRLYGSSPFTTNTIQPAYYRLPVPENYNLIYRDNASKIACMGPEHAVMVVQFYQLIQSVLADVSPGGFLYEGTRDLEQMAQTIEILEIALTIGKDIAGLKEWSQVEGTPGPVGPAKQSRSDS
ncbi:hypothetical protein [Stutzerimonas nitrititolerans]|uniref:hypothetical protein n=1 Tax=Stutzerimonas nitrititolerans TaxID=2482751 RepID=UPI0028B24995|nr:hypothetical protein [Stutzerimonas nitrititolerans]